MCLVSWPAALEAFGDALGDVDGGGFHLEREAGLLFGRELGGGGENFHGQGVGFLPDLHFFEAVDARAAAAAVVILIVVALVHSLAATVVGRSGRTVFHVKITVIVVTGHAEPAFRGSGRMCMGVGLPLKRIIPTIEAARIPDGAGICGYTCGRSGGP